MIGNKNANKITKVPKTSPLRNSETVTNEEENIGLDREIHKERCISSEKRQKNYWWSKINIMIVQ